MPQYLTTDEVANHYRTSARNVRRWQTEGYGPRAVKIGRRLLYDTTELARFDAEAARVSTEGVAA